MCNADRFSKTEAFYWDSFERVLKLFIYSYGLILEDENLTIDLKNEKETKIRNFLVTDYLQLTKHKKIFGISDLYFIPEPQDTDKKTYETKGFTDIKVLNIINSLSLSGTERIEDIHFTFECKLLDGEADLTRKYIKNGITRFTVIDKFSEPKYSVKMPLAGMIGFIQNGKIEAIVSDINKRLSNPKQSYNIKTLNFLTYFEAEKDFEYSYHSIHERQSHRPQISLYHLMFDFSQIDR